MRDCPSCEQGKHRICDEEVLDDDDNEVPCPCAEREHCTLVNFVPVDESEDE